MATTKKKQTTNYLTLDDANDFRTISKIMSDAGYSMNHATARNYFFESIKTILTNICIDLKIDFDSMKIDDLVKMKEVHDALYDVIYLAYEQNKKGIANGIGH